MSLFVALFLTSSNITQNTVVYKNCCSCPANSWELGSGIKTLTHNSQVRNCPDCSHLGCVRSYNVIPIDIIFLFLASTTMFFWKNKKLETFYWSMFIMTFGISLINVFIPIYLFNAGFHIHQILFFYFLVSLYFVLLAYPGAKITAKIGAKYSILISTLFLILHYIGLIFIDSYNFLFILLPLLFSLRMVFFNYGYHLHFIKCSSTINRGQEIATAGIITSLAIISAPYIGSLLATIHFSILFLISSVLIFLGSLPLFFSKNIKIDIYFSRRSIFRRMYAKEFRGNCISFSGYAIESFIGRVIWPIFLIILIGTLDKTGFIISISTLVSLLAFHLIGKLTDTFNKIKLLKIGTFLYVLAWIARIFADTAGKVFYIDSYKNLSEKILHLPWSAHSYDLAERGNYFEFIVSREIIYNLSRVLFLPILILLFWIDFFPFTISFIIASVSSLGYIFINSEEKKPIFKRET